MSTRQYTVTQRNSAGKVITRATYARPEEAFSSFVSALADVGHDEHRLRLHHQALTVALMKGADGMEVLDPGLQGSVSIDIRARP